MPSPSRRIAHLQGIRAIAVALVVLFHFDELLPGGFIGVDVFFVLSGYLIVGGVAATLVEGTAPDVTDLLRRRLRRLAVPLAGTVTVVLAVAPFIVRAGAEAERLLRVAAANVVGLANLELYRQQDYFAPTAEASPLLHTWSLGAELQFYVATALLLLILRRRLTGAAAVRDLRRALVAVGSVSFALAVVLSMTPEVLAPLLDRPLDVFFYVSPARYWQFVAGGLLAVRHACRHGSDRAGPATGAAMTALGALVVAAVMFGGGVRYSALLAVIPTVATLLLIASLRRAGPARSLLSVPALVAVGDRSYSIYLWHWPFLALAAGIGAGPGERLVALLLSLGAAELSYRVLEPTRVRDSGSAVTRVRLHHRMRPRWVAGALAGLLPAALAINLGLILASASTAEPEAALEVFSNGVDECESSGPNGDLGGPSRVLLVGDSHAGSLAPALEACLRVAGMTLDLALQAGCSALLGVVAEDPQVAGRCDPWQREVLAGIAAEPPSHVVVLSYATARTSLIGRGEVLPAFRIRAADGTPAADHDTALALYDKGLGDFLAAVHAVGPDVVLLTTLPDFEGEVVLPPRLIRAAGGTPYDLVPTPPIADERLHAVNSVEESVAVRAGVAVVRTEEVLCDTMCEQVSATGDLLFRDSDHLAPEGARRLARAVLAALVDQG